MNRKDIDFFVFQPGSADPDNGVSAGEALCRSMTGECPDRSYSQMMQYRLRGEAAGECIDRYFIAIAGEECIARLWHGWGDHADAIANFGNFATREDHQGMGIGRKLLAMWFEDIQSHPSPPLGMFCTSKPHLIELYKRYGFRSAMSDKNDPAPLYKPCLSKARTFQEFCEDYYTPSDTLQIRRGTVGDRHEIDCLLRFVYRELKIPFGFEGVPGYEPLFLAAAAGKNNPPEVIVTPGGRIVGWAYTAPDGRRFIQLHPAYSAESLL